MNTIKNRFFFWYYQSTRDWQISVKYKDSWNPIRTLLFHISLLLLFCYPLGSLMRGKLAFGGRRGRHFRGRLMRYGTMIDPLSMSLNQTRKEEAPALSRYQGYSWALESTCFFVCWLISCFKWLGLSEIVSDRGEDSHAFYLRPMMPFKTGSTVLIKWERPVNLIYYAYLCFVIKLWGLQRSNFYFG